LGRSRLASLKTIAAEAGVGTLYRRFPTRDDLVEATYRDETARLSESALDLLSDLPPDRALRAWMEDFVDYVQTKHGMSDALPAILGAQEGLRARSRELLRDALARLLDACIASGSAQPVDPADVLMALGGITLIAAHENQRMLATRLIDLLLAGLRPHASARRQTSTAHKH
jgi:AcrR family transcriptional regulator